MNNRFANMEALKEIYSVLNSGGIFGMIWNVEDCS
jgi:preprotein translocase subunit YajC